MVKKIDTISRKSDLTPILFIFFLSVFLFLPNIEVAQAQSLEQRLQGRLLLQVEDRGRIWYVNPLNLKRQEILFSHDIDSFAQLALGINNKDFEKLSSDKQFAKKLKGRFLIQVENKGQLWYVNPVTNEKIKLSSQNIQSVLKSLVLGISNENLFKIFEQRSTSYSCAVLNGQDRLKKIELPKEIATVERINYLAIDERLLLVVSEANGQRALWSYDNEKTFKRLIKLDHPLSNGFVDLDSKNNIYFQTDYPYYLYRSEDSGQTWESVGQKGMDTFWGLAESEDSVLYGAAWSELGNSPHLYQSVDQGKTWKLWKNFWEVFPEKAVLYDPSDPRRKLRHLHDVVVYKDTLVLGTGDVAGQTLISQNNGQTWQEILDNGFTSHILLPQEDKILLGGDSSRGHGINIFDFKTGQIQKVWSPLDCEWSGYIHDMMESQENYYATVQIENYSGLKYGVLTSTDAYHWQPLFEFKADPKIFHIPVFIATGPLNKVYLSINHELYFFQ